MSWAASPPKEESSEVIEEEGAEAMETQVTLVEETRDEETLPGEGKAITIVTPRSSLHPSPDSMEVQHPDPAS